jgi:TRAP-type mannitol/chloroaromatic compound transport system substrate-binding protein
LPLPDDIEQEIVRADREHFDKQAATVKDPYYKKVLESQRAFKALCDYYSIR